MPLIERVAVIGAGAAGLCAARHLTRFKQFETVVFEATEHVGGTWVYTDCTDKDEAGYLVHSSMYNDLVTNLPKQVMAFPDLSFKQSLPSFVSHKDVLEYLQSYSDFFGLKQYIKFNTEVEEVNLLPNGNYPMFPKWEIKTLNRKTNQHKTHQFDAVMVCVGHYAIPNVPDIEGKSKFKGRIMHSHYYRKKEEFSGQVVVLFGAKSSGIDIALNLSKVAKQVVLSHKGPSILSPLPENMIQKPSISMITEYGVVFEDGTSIDCQSIMFCTGYNYTYPFFKDTSIIKIEKNHVMPLYKHMLHIHYNNLSLIGVCRQICPFPQFHCQVLYAIGAMTGSVQLPSTEKMILEEKEDYEGRLSNGCLPVRGAHILGGKQWSYNDELADLSGNQRIPNEVRLLYDLCHQRRAFNVQDYKKDEFEREENGHYYRSNAD